MAPFSTQPLPNSMNAYGVELCNDEKSSNQCTIHLDSRMQCACAADSNPAHHRSCHKERLRKFLLPVVVLLLAVGATLAISCVYDINLFDLVGLGIDSSSGPLSKRQTSSFTNNKREFIFGHMFIIVVSTQVFSFWSVYLIIVFVGLLLVLIAGIMLSFWCCKGEIVSYTIVNRTHLMVFQMQALSRIHFAAHATCALAAVGLVCTHYSCYSAITYEVLSACLECVGCGLCAAGLEAA